MLTLIIILIGLVALFAGLFYISLKAGTLAETQRLNLGVQLRNQDQDIRDAEGQAAVARAEVKRITNKMIEVQNHATLVEKDAASRMEEFKKHPTIACMTDGQVSILAEMLAIHLRDILSSPKEYVN